MKLEECRDILDALLSSPRCNKRLLRCRDLVQSAIQDFFTGTPGEIAGMGQCFPDEFPDEEVVHLARRPEDTFAARELPPAG
jgi:hypothetical protein